MGDLKITGLQGTPVKYTEKEKQKSSSEFGRIIKGAIDRVETLEREADKSIIDLLKRKGNIPETMIALQKADVSMRLLLAVRNKVIGAYREIMHMQF